MRGVEAGARDLENSTELEVVTHDLSEKGGVGLGRLCAGGELGDGDAGLSLTKPSTCAKSVLRQE